MAAIEDLKMKRPLFHITVLLAAVAASLPAPAGRAASDQPRAVSSGDLELRLSDGRWLVPREVELRRELRRLPTLAEAVRAAQRDLRQAAATAAVEHAARRSRAAVLEGRLQQVKKRLAMGLGRQEKQQLQQQAVAEQQALERLRQATLQPEELGGWPPVRRRIIELTNARNDLAVALLKIQAARAQLAEQYQQLMEDDRLAQLLRRAGPDAKTGPVEDYHAARLTKRLAGHEAIVFNNRLPLYRDGNRLRIAGMINQTPVTFTLLTSAGDPPLLTAGALEAAGLTAPEDAPTVKLRAPGGDWIEGRQMVVPYLRFGKTVLRNVPFIALPPEGGGLGSRIGPAAFGEVSFTPQPKLLQCLVGQ